MEKKRFSFKDIIFIIVTTLLTATCAVMGVYLIYHKTVEKSYKNYFEQYYNEHVQTYKVENANFSKGQIIFIGDSITDLYHLDDYYADLDKASYNRGIGGDTTQGVINRLQVSLYDLEPSEIVLMIGINDINGGKSNDYVINNYKTILDGIKSKLPTTKVFTMSILPVNDLLNGAVNVTNTNSKVMDINTHIQQMATDKGYTYVDLFSQVKDENNKLISTYTDDGIHPNANGYAVWTNLLKPLL